MVEGDLGCCLIAVGQRYDGLVIEALGAAAEYEVEASRCDDIYAAVAELALRRRCILVIGPLKELARENGRFFHVAARNGARCSVLLEGSNSRRCEVMAALHAGAWVMDTVDEVRGVVESWLTSPGCPPDGFPSAGGDFQASEAELDALLGQETDG